MKTAQAPKIYNAEDVQKQFPIFKNHKDIVYLDNAATTQIPTAVQDAMLNYMQNQNGSPHRGAHRLSVEATSVYDTAREKTAAFIHAGSKNDCIFTRNTTESLNLIAYGYLLNHLRPGDKIVTAITAHHSLLVPLQMVSQKTGAHLEYLYCDGTGFISDDELLKIDSRTKAVLVPWISNGLGVKHNISQIEKRTHRFDAIFVVDGAQAAGHVTIDVQKQNIDLLAFSGHKMFAPGIGVLYGKPEILNQFQPFLRGGDMIEYVEEQSATFAPLPERLEAGTQSVLNVTGLSAAIDFIKTLDERVIESHEKMLTQYAYAALSKLKNVTVYGPESIENRGSLIVFNVDGVHPHDVASILDHYGIAIRAGHHCCQPLMKHLGLWASCRVSFSVYNTKADIDQFIQGLHHVKEVFKIA